MPTIDVRSVLGPSGSIAAKLPQYESRPQQLVMAEAVANAIETREHLVVEAGTGVGKSFAYLVPAILAAVDRELKIVVATHTIALQEQLFAKDVPFLREVMPVEFSAELVKGRSNYISLRRLQSASDRSEALFEKNAGSQLADLRHWARQNSDGSRQDLPFAPMPEVWDAVASDAGNCLGRKCGTYWRCHYYNMQRRAQQAQVLIVNHALLMNDLRLRDADAALLPDYDIVIFDEAHSLAGVAAEHLGLQVTSGAVKGLLNRLFNERTRKGLLSTRDEREAVALVRAANIASDQFFDQIADWLRTHAPANGRARAPIGIPNVLGEALRKLSSAIERAAKAFDDKPEQRIEYDSAVARCDALAGEIGNWLDQSLDSGVYWARIDAGWGRRVTLSGVPLDVGPMLRRTLWDRGPTCILTSATLAVGNPPDVRFVTDALGLRAPRMKSVGSPFDYASQVTLHAPRGLPDPSTDSAAFETAAIETIPRYVEMTGGSALVLFTSNRAMQRATEALRPWFEERGIRLISQSDGAHRSRMLDEFRSDLSSVLFGVASFWQGIDVPGAALSNVIIAKLPFAPPDDPVGEARREAYERAGRRYFNEYSLPEAILTLRQGFGRLIRSRQDRGIVVILDPRVHTKAYGRTFLDSLPQCSRVVERLRPTGRG